MSANTNRHEDKMRKDHSEKQPIPLIKTNVSEEIPVKRRESQSSHANAIRADLKEVATKNRLKPPMSPEQRTGARTNIAVSPQAIEKAAAIWDEFGSDTGY